MDLSILDFRRVFKNIKRLFTRINVYTANGSYIYFHAYGVHV